MAMPWSTIIAAGSAGLQTLASGIGAGKRDKKNREFTEQQNKLNRDFTLEMWNREQAYNDPSAQMARYKQAGLNPNLIYGQSNTTSAPSAPQQTTHQNQADIGEAVFKGTQSYVQAKQLESQLKYQENQNQLLQQEKALKAAQTTQVMGQTDMTKEQLRQYESLWDTTLASAENTVLQQTLTHDQTRKNILNTGLTFDKIQQEIQNLESSKKLTDKQIQHTAKSIDVMVQTIKNLKIQGKGYKIDNEIKRFTSDMYKRGQNPNDPAILRIIGRVLEESGFVDHAIKNVKSWTDILKLFNR